MRETPTELRRLDQRIAWQSDGEIAIGDATRAARVPFVALLDAAMKIAREMDRADRASGQKGL